MNQQWYLLKTQEDYNRAIDRYEVIKNASKGSAEFEEKMLLVHLIELYETEQWILPEVDPIAMIKIRMEELGLKLNDLANVYGDKGTVSKVLNYKQGLSLTMIRKFSRLLNLPIGELTKEYELAETANV
jgi:HTH-type transcriptional regulator/antitoxin HigA